MKYFLIVLMAAIGYFLWSPDEDSAPEYSFVANDVKFTLPSFEIELIAQIQPRKSSELQVTLSEVETLSDAIVIPVVETLAAEEINDLSFYQFTQNLKEHLQRGLAVNELEQLYKAGKAQDWPIDWIFEPADRAHFYNNEFNLNDSVQLTLHGLYFSHNFFTLSEAVRLPNGYKREQQIDAFNQLLVSCDLCDQNSGGAFNLVYMIEFENNPPNLVNHKIGHALAMIYARQLAELVAVEQGVIDTQMTEIDEQIEFLLQSDNEYLREHGELTQIYQSQDPIQIVELFKRSEAIELDFIIHLLKTSLEVTQAQSYDVVAHRLKKGDTISDLDQVMDFIIYHGQYFSIREATELLNSIQAKQDISDHPVWKTFKNASTAGFDQVAKKWLSEVDQSDLFAGITDQKGRPFNAQKAKFKLMNKMTGTNNIEKTYERWLKGFNDPVKGQAIFTQMNWPILVHDFGFGTTPGNHWNNNVAALNKMNINNDFDVISIRHLMNINRFAEGTMLNQSQRDELKYIYPMLLPSEQKWLEGAPDSDDKRYVMGR